MYRLSRTLPNLGPATPARPGMANHPPRAHSPALSGAPGLWPSTCRFGPLRPVRTGLPDSRTPSLPHPKTRFQRPILHAPCPVRQAEPHAAIPRGRAAGSESRGFSAGSGGVAATSPTPAEARPAPRRRPAPPSARRSCAARAASTFLAAAWVRPSHARAAADPRRPPLRKRRLRLVLRGQLDRLREMCERARLPRSFGLTGSRRPAAPSPAGCG